MTEAKTGSAVGLGVVYAAATATLIGHLLVASRYGYFGDELYFMACGEHLDWGYVDQPPLIALIAWIVRHALGTSLLAMRLPSALAGAALVVLTGALARELGGGRFATALAALASALAGVYIVMSYLFSMNAFEPLFWTGCAYVVVRIIKTGDQRLWLWFGAIAGVGLENKYSMAVFAMGLVAGMLLSPGRGAFARPWIWLGGGVAMLIFLPNLIWNVQHGWPFFELMRNIRASGRDVALGPIEFVTRQMLNMNPSNAPVWLTGVVWLFLSKRGRLYRPLGWGFVLTLAAFIVTKGKDYYLAPAFACVFAAGAVALESITERGAWRALRPTLVALQLLSLLFLPLGLPILSPQRLVDYQRWLGFAPPATEKAHAGAPIPHHFAFQFGWDEMVAAVAQAYWALTPEERAKTVILGNNYAEAGAVDLLGPAYGLPKSISGHQSYWLWGHGHPSAGTVIWLGRRPENIERWCGDIQVAAELSHPYAAVWEHRPVLVCRQLRLSLDDLWPQIRTWK